MNNNKMIASISESYGSSDVIELKKIEIPNPKSNELLIKVNAVTVNRTDCGILSGKPFFARVFYGIRKPKNKITGTDFAGEVVDKGIDVNTFKIGDKVFGFKDDGISSHAEYMVVSEEESMSIIPDGISYELAVASCEGFHYALNMIKKVNIIKNEKSVVYGASGAIGSALLQLLKHYELYVTAVVSSRNVELIKSLGADKVIDYSNEDFTKDDEKYIYIFDAVGKSTFGECKKILSKGGIYMSSDLGSKGQNIILPLLTKIYGDKKVKFPIPTDTQYSIDLAKELLANGGFKPIIDREYPFEKIKEAYDYVKSGHKVGNVIIRID